MVLYEIVNPSDHYTIECLDLEIAFVACVLLGRGQYAFTPADGTEGGVPLFLFGGADAFCGEHFGRSVDDVLLHVTTNRALDLAQAFESVVIGDRAGYLAARDRAAATAEGVPADFWDVWHEDHRSSLNDIGRRARRMAVQLRRGHQPVTAVPQQIFTSGR